MVTKLTPRYQWQLREENHALSQKLSDALGLHPVTAQALINRGILDEAEAKAFLEPSWGILPDPATLPDFHEAVAALKDAIENHRKIQIHGDYDADGISGSALLVRLLRLLGNEADVFIPDRGKDGYSLGERSLQVADEFGAELVITVDNGTSAIEQMAKLADKGIKVVIIDHHPPAKERPICAALVNPWCSPGADARTGKAGTCYPFLCGTGVAWILAWGLLRELHGEATLPESHRRFLLDSMGLAALATVADVMPLTGANRSLVHLGLKSIKDSSFPGIRELVKASGIRGELRSSDLGFRLAPRINAAGRMSSAETSFRLLASSQLNEAGRLAAEIEALNQDRRSTERKDIFKLMPQAEEQYQAGNKVLFAGGADTHVGILGIVAARLTDKYTLPTLAWSQTEPGLARGSARAPEGTNLMDILEAVGHLFKSFGGHARAAGFSFDPAKQEELQQALILAATQLPAPPPPTIKVDTHAGPRDMSVKTVRELQKLEPFGEANREPVFCCEGATISRIRTLGKDETHLELTLERNGTAIRTLAWNMASSLGNLPEGQKVDVAYTVGINSFRGQSSVEWTLKDIRISE